MMEKLLVWVIWPTLTAEIAAFSVESLTPGNTIAGLTAVLSGYVFWWVIYLAVWLIIHQPKEPT